MGFTHYDAVSMTGRKGAPATTINPAGYYVGLKGSEVQVIDLNGNWVGNGNITTTGAVTGTTFGGPISALTPGVTITLNCALADTFTLTPGQSCTVNATNIITGQFITMVITSAGSSYTVTPGTNFKHTGALNTGATAGKVFTISYVCDGTNLNEIGRTTAM